MNLTLTWADAEGPQRRDFLGPVTFVIGRAPGVDVVIPDNRISRRQCSIEVTKDEVRLVDLGSANGSYVNGKKTPKAVLEDGDRVLLGRVELGVSLARGSTQIVTNGALNLGMEASRSVKLPEGDEVEIAGYRFGRCLGQGGFGAVFEAWSPLGEIVAMKVLKLRSDIGEEDKQRFFREAAAASSIQHPNVVRILDQGQSGPVYYIVMEFVPGETVRALLERDGPLPLRQSLEIARAVAAALEAARRADLVHRDVKPENFLIGTNGSIKLADFGMAKSVLTAGRSGLTRAGDIVGTLAYMAPEQLGASIYADHKSDIYSLGASLYHMLSGRTIFTAKAQLDLIKKILEQEPTPITTVRPDIPPIVHSIIDRCTRKNPADRYGTAGEIVRTLDMLLAKANTKSTMSDE